MEEDLGEIQISENLTEALERLLLRIRYVPALGVEDFMRDYGDTRFGRLLMYLLIYRNKALDWDQRGARIGFEDAELLAGFQPQFHHVFPEKFLEGHIDAPLVDAMSNIAVIGPSINIRISKQNPMDYIPRSKIDAAKLRQQFISGQITNTSVKQYPEWLCARAEELAGAGNSFLEDLRGELNLPAIVVETEKQDYAYDVA